MVLAELHPVYECIFKPDLPAGFLPQIDDSVLYSMTYLKNNLNGGS